VHARIRTQTPMGSGSGKDNGGLMQAPSIRDGAMLRNTPGPRLREQGASESESDSDEHLEPEPELEPLPGPPRALLGVPAAGGACSHLSTTCQGGNFRKLLRRQFPPDQEGTAAGASSHGRGGGGSSADTSTGAILRCDICGSEDNVWMCMDCGQLLCLRAGSCHAAEHVHGGGSRCRLMLSCLDCHVYCCACERYL
jgi:hypothetical protein